MIPSLGFIANLFLSATYAFYWRFLAVLLTYDHFVRRTVNRLRFRHDNKAIIIQQESSVPGRLTNGNNIPGTELSCSSVRLAKFFQMPSSKLSFRELSVLSICYTNVICYIEEAAIVGFVTTAYL